MYLGVLVIIALQIVTSSRFLPIHKTWLAVVEIILLLAVAAITEEGYHRVSYWRRQLSFVLIAIVGAINLVSLALLLQALWIDHSGISGRQLLINGMVIYFTNMLVFALGYWEMDGRGPDVRIDGQTKRDFLFPQMVHSKYAGDYWLPGFTDYLYLSATNVTNFASADSQPLTHRAKLMMMLQSIIAVVTVVLVLARAINILS